MAERRATSTGLVTISGVTLHVYVLDDGSRIIDADDIAALLEARANGVPVTPLEAEIAARFIRGMPFGGSGA